MMGGNSRIKANKDSHIRRKKSSCLRGGDLAVRLKPYDLELYIAWVVDEAKVYGTVGDFALVQSQNFARRLGNR